MTDFLKKTLYSCFVTKSYLIFLFKSINDTRIDNKIRLDFILSIKLPYFVTLFQFNEIVFIGPLAEWLRQSSAKAFTAVRIR